MISLPKLPFIYRICTELANPTHVICLGLARTIYIRCIYGIFGREITKYTVIYGVYVRFWPTLHMSYRTATTRLLCLCPRTSKHSIQHTPCEIAPSSRNLQVNYVLSDKTGTLTRNVMEFFKASIGGVSYGAGITEVERSNAIRCVCVLVCVCVCARVCM